MNRILINQNNEEQIRLLKASSVAYLNAKRGEIIITYFILFFGIAFPIIIVLFTKNNKSEFFLFACSFLFTIMVEIFRNTLEGNTSKGAIFKEQFDTKIFGLRWKSTIKELDGKEISNYSLKYKGKEISNWYSQGLSEAIPHDVAVAILQHSNTAWDIDLRRLYVNYTIGFLIFYTVCLWVFLLYKDVDTKTILLIYFSVISVYTHFITQIRGHNHVIKKRQAISERLDKIICKESALAENELRDVQDEIYDTRLESAKVPNFFFRWFKKRMDVAAEDYIQYVNSFYKI